MWSFHIDLPFTTLVIIKQNPKNLTSKVDKVCYDFCIIVHFSHFLVAWTARNTKYGRIWKKFGTWHLNHFISNPSMWIKDNNSSIIHKIFHFFVENFSWFYFSPFTLQIVVFSFSNQFPSDFDQSESSCHT